MTHMVNAVKHVGVQISQNQLSCVSGMSFCWSKLTDPQMAQGTWVHALVVQLVNNKIVLIIDISNSYLHYHLICWYSNPQL